jgi:phage repressor protein C with HTH and peptisase S24 domain
METSMLTHAQIWNGLDRLAARAKLSPSGLAKRAGLDPTTFNKSKRITPDGRARWPSTESLAKALAATNVSIDSFVSLISEEGGGRNVLPMISFAQASNGGYFDERGHPTGSGWQEIAFPAVHDEHAYALEIVGDGMQPTYRDGDVIIVSPAAPVRRGDRLVIKTRGGELMLKELTRQNPQALELKSVNDGGPDRTLTPEDIAWMARIVWARQ